jgi:hypothetical protein
MIIFDVDDSLNGIFKIVQVIAVLFHKRPSNVLFRNFARMPSLRRHSNPTPALHHSQKRLLLRHPAQVDQANPTPLVPYASA